MDLPRKAHQRPTGPSKLNFSALLMARSNATQAIILESVTASDRCAFPRSLHRVDPRLSPGVEKSALHRPGEFVRYQLPAPPLMERVHDFAKDIELQLVDGGITYPHRF